MASKAAFKADKRPEKINAGIGYLIDPQTGKPFSPDVARMVTLDATADWETSYLPQHGHAGYLESHGREMVFGRETWDSMPGAGEGKKPDNMAWIQALGGTGALSITADFFDQFLPEDRKKLLLDGGWGNHKTIFSAFEITEYDRVAEGEGRYNHAGYMEALKAHPEGAPVLLQAAGYNGDGLDRTAEEWDEIVEVIKDRNLIPIVDFAYNGLAKGFDEDNQIIRSLVVAEVPMFVNASNSKNFLYNARLGSVYAVNWGDATNKIQDALCYAEEGVRPNFSNAPFVHAEALDRILRDENLAEMYRSQIDRMATQVLDANRLELAATLARVNSPSPEVAQVTNWVRNGSGLFVNIAPGGLGAEQTRFLQDEKAIYTAGSRINLGGIPPEKMPFVADAVREVLS